MNPVHLQLDCNEKDALNFRPGDVLQGTASWADDGSQRVEIRLFWFTFGVQSRQIGLVEKQVIDRPGFQTSTRFSFVLPDGPWSYVGCNTGLSWAVEVVALPSRRHSMMGFNLGPTGEVIWLLPPPPPAWESEQES